MRSPVDVIRYAVLMDTGRLSSGSRVGTEDAEVITAAVVFALEEAGYAIVLSGGDHQEAPSE
jgi:hypothetical protein